MPFPETIDDFRALVREMRALGVLVAFGVTLGAEPPRVAQLEAEAARAPKSDAARLNAELADERRRIRLEARRAALRLDLEASGHAYSDEEIDRLLGPDAEAA